MKKFIFLFLTVFNILISFSQQKNGLSFIDTNANLRFESNSKLSPTFKIIYHQKKIKIFENGSYDNISLGIGFTIFNQKNLLYQLS